LHDKNAASAAADPPPDLDFFLLFDFLDFDFLDFPTDVLLFLIALIFKLRLIIIC